MVSPSPLLSLPRELRNLILDDVIQSPRPLPRYPGPDSTLRPSDREWFENFGERPLRPDWLLDQLPIYFEGSPTAFAPTCYSLLRTCRQLRAETLEQEAKKKIPYRLDMVIVNGESVWITWLSMPVHRPLIIDHLQISIRIAGALRTKASACILHAIDPWHMVYLTERLLMRILAQGTHRQPPNYDMGSLQICCIYAKYLKPRFSIRFLDVRIQSEVYRNEDEMLAGRGMEMLQLFASGESSGLWRVMNPFDYYSALKKAFTYLLLIPDHRWGLFRGPGARIFRERIGGFWLGYMEEGIGMPNLSGVYRWNIKSVTKTLAGKIRDILLAREENGVGLTAEAGPFWYLTY